MTDLLALADLVEKLMGPDREIDGEICLALGWTHQKMKGDSKPYYRKPGDKVYYLRSEPPAYTGSLDAAMTLAPEGYKWRCGYSRHVPHNAEVIDYSAHTGTFIGESDASRCLALLAAILRARQSEFINDKA